MANLARGRVGWSTGIAAVVVVVVTIVVTLPFRSVGINLADEGFMVQVASDLLAGRRLYADAVVYAWPGAFYLTAAAFALFGESMIVARTLAVVVFATAAGAVFLMARWFHGLRGAALCAAVFIAYRVWAYPHWHMINYSSLAMAMVLVGMWLAGEALARPGWRWAVAAGLAFGAAALTKQDLGIVSTGLVGLGLLALVPRERIRATVLGYGVGAALPIVVGAGVLAVQGALDDAIRESILVPLRGVSGFSGYPPRPPLWPLFAQDPDMRARVYGYVPAVLADLYWTAIARSWLFRRTVLFDVAIKVVFYLPWAAAIVATARIGMRAVRTGSPMSARDRRLALVVFGVIASQAAFNPPRDWVHLLVLYPPTLVLLAAIAGTSGPRSGWGRRVGEWGVSAAVVGGLLASAALAVELGRAYDVPVRTRRGTLHGPREQAEPLQALVDDLSREPDAPLLVLPYHPLPNFLVGRRPPTSHYSVWPAEVAALRDGAIIAGLQRRPDTTIVYCPMQVPYYPRPEDYAARLFGFLADHYETTAVHGGTAAGFAFVVGHRRERPAGRRLPVQGLTRAARLVPRPGVTRPRNLPPPVGPLARVRVWPFVRTVEVQAPLYAAVEMAIEVDVRRGERFAAVVGAPADALGDPFAPRRRFTVLVDGTPIREIANVELNPRERARDRGWVPIEADLGPWAGRRVRLLLQTTRLDGQPRSVEVAGWGDLRMERASGTSEAQRE